MLSFGYEADPKRGFAYGPPIDPKKCRGKACEKPKPIGYWGEGARGILYSKWHSPMKYFWQLTPFVREQLQLKQQQRKFRHELEVACMTSGSTLQQSGL